MKVPVIAAEDGLKALRERLGSANRGGKHEIFAFYSSVLGGITKDPVLCAVPIDDHMATRGHAVFDTANVKNGKCYGLSFHLDRLMNSAIKARINLAEAKWLGSTSDPAAQKEGLKNIVLNTIAASGKRDNVYVRFWLSVGRGDFAINPSECLDKCNFYVVVHSSGPATGNEGFIMYESTVSVPLKNPRLATLKSTNYLINALCAMEACDKTGKKDSLGLQVDENGHLAEFSIGSIGLVGDDGVLRTPKLDRILRSTTVVRAFQLAREQLMPRGIVNGVEFADLKPKDALNAREILEFGGGSVRAVVQLDGQLVGNGSPGPVTMALKQLLAKEQADSEFLDHVPYNSYEEENTKRSKL